MQPKQPKVSVIMSVYNTDKYIAEAIESILDQTFKDFEFIIVDDGSTDRSLSIAKRYALKDGRITILIRAGTGVERALNDALEMAKGTYVVRCDSDDRYLKDRLSWQIEFLDNHPFFGVVCGRFGVIAAGGSNIRDLECGDHKPEDITDEFKKGVTRTHFNTFMVKKEHLVKLGGFREYFCGMGDIDMQFRLSNICSIWYEPRLSYYYRLRPFSIVHSCKTNRKEFFDSINRKFQQQRLERGKDDLELGYSPPVPENDTLKPYDARTHVCEMLIGRAWNEHKNGNKTRAVITGFRCCFTQPFRVSRWINLIKILIKPCPK